MAADNPIERIRVLDAERNRLRDGAKKEALARAQKAVGELNALGFAYRLLNGATSKKATRQSRNGRGTIKNAPCPVCKFKTNPPHDARAHRGQKRKSPFTGQDLKEREYARA